MLHGTGGNEQEIATLAAELDPRAGVLAPRGRVRESGMARWFRRHGEGVFDVDDVIVRAGELAGFVTAAREHHSWGDRPLVAVGFSNGANIALATAILHPTVVDRVIAFSGMYPFGDREVAADLRNVRIVTLNGESDPMAPLASVNRLADSLRERGADVHQHLRPGGHGIAMSDLDAARAALRQLA
jgi:phospholipase/carboxylesterase